MNAKVQHGSDACYTDLQVMHAVMDNSAFYATRDDAKIIVCMDAWAGRDATMEDASDARGNNKQCRRTSK